MFGVTNLRLYCGQGSISLESISSNYEVRV